MEKPKISFIIDESIKNAVSGVYMIKFSSKHFYIGCSKNLKKRINTHMVGIRDGGKAVNGIKFMGVFSGKVTFVLLEEINAETHGESWVNKLFLAESRHMNAKWRSKYCLNRHSVHKRPEKAAPIATLCSISAELVIVKSEYRYEIPKRPCFVCPLLIVGRKDRGYSSMYAIEPFPSNNISNMRYSFPRKGSSLYVY